MYRELARCIRDLSDGRRTSKRPEDRKIVSDYLAALAPVLARAVLGDDILKDLQCIERLFGHTFLIDPEPFEQGFESWRKFREEYEDFVMSGMTINERISALDLLDEFDSACKNRDRGKIRSILERIRLNPESIESLIEEYIKST